MLLIGLETNNVRFARWAAIPMFGALAMFCVSFLPTLVAIFASIPFVIQHRGFLSSPTPWTTIGMLASAFWNFWLEKRGTQFRFFWIVPSWIAFAGFAACCLVMSLLEATGVAGPFFR